MATFKASKSLSRVSKYAASVCMSRVSKYAASVCMFFCAHFILPVVGSTRGEPRNLQEAAHQGNVSVVEQLIAGGANVVEKFGSYSRDPLMFAAMNGNVDVARLLWTKIQADHRDFDVNAKDLLNQYSALLFAAKSGHTDVFKLKKNLKIRKYLGRCEKQFEFSGVENSEMNFSDRNSNFVSTKILILLLLGSLPRKRVLIQVFKVLRIILFLW